MRCPKCGFASFDHNATCPKCKKSLAQVQQNLKLLAINPQKTNFVQVAMDFQLNEMRHLADQGVGDFQEGGFDSASPPLGEAPVQPGAPQFGPAPVQPAAPQFGPAPAQPGAPQFGPAPAQPGAPQFGPAPVQPGAPQFGPAPVQPAAPQFGPAPAQPVAPQFGPAPAQPGAPQFGPAPVQPGAPQFGPAPAQPVAPQFGPAPGPVGQANPAATMPPANDPLFEEAEAMMPRLPRSPSPRPVPPSASTLEAELDELPVELEIVHDLVSSEATMPLGGHGFSTEVPPQAINTAALSQMPFSRGFEAETFTVADLPIDPEAGRIPQAGDFGLPRQAPGALNQGLDVNFSQSVANAQVEDFSASAYNAVGEVTSLPPDTQTGSFNLEDSDLDDLFADDDVQPRK